MGRRPYFYRERKRMWLTLLKWGSRMLLVFCILAIAAAFGAYIYLTTRGLPPVLLHTLIVEVQKRGIDFSAAHVRLNSVNSVTFEKFRLAESNGPLPLILHADEVALDFNFQDWPFRNPAVRRVSVSRGLLQARIADSANPSVPLTVLITNLNVHYDIQSDRLHFCDLSAQCLGLDLQAYGRVVNDRSRRVRRRVTQPEKPWLLSSKASLHIPGWLPNVLRELDAARFARLAKASLSFEVHPADFRKDRAVLFVEGAGTRVRGVCLEEWSATAQLAEGKLIVPSAYARQGMESVFVSGSYDLEKRLVEAHMSGKLMPGHWVGNMPSSWREVLERRRMTLKGLLEFDARVSRCPVKEAGCHVSGWAAATELDIDGWWIETLFATFARSGEALALREFSAITGRGTDRGLVRGRVEYDLKTKGYGGRMNLNVDPRPILAKFGLNLNAYPSIFFKAAPPDVDLSFHGTVRKPETFALSSLVRAGDFIYNGQPVTFFNSQISFSNNVLTLDPMMAVFEDGIAEGRINCDFAGQTVDLDLAASASPRAIARVAGPFLEQQSRRYRFEGPTRMVAHGRVDYGTNLTSDLEVAVDGKRLGIEWFLADEGAFIFRYKANEIRLDDIRASWCGGDLRGRLLFANVNAPSNVLYAVSGEVNGASFSNIVQALGQENAYLYDGRVAGTCEVAGVIGEGRGDTAVGEGRLTISRGNLMEIPLLGPLSWVLSRLYPGLGYTQQRKFKASFFIKDRQFHTGDAELQGRIVTIRGKGDYHFNKALDFRVNFEPLKEGMVAEAVRLVTYPATMFLEFHLGGTPTQPKWRAVRIPKELRRFLPEINGGKSGGRGEKPPPLPPPPVLKDPAAE